MAMTSLSIMLTVFVLQLHHAGPHQRTVPAWIRTFVVGYVAQALCMRSHIGSYYGTSPSTTAAEAVETGTCEDRRRARPSQRQTATVSEVESHCKFFNFRSGSKNSTPLVSIPSVRVESGTTSAADSEDNGCSRLRRQSLGQKFWSAASASVISTSCSAPDDDDENEKSFRRAYGEPRPSVVESLLGSLGASRRRKRSSVNVHERVIARHLKLYLSRNRAEQEFEDVVNEWRLVAHVMDRLLFWLFLIGSVLSTVTILIVMPMLKPNLTEIH